MELKTFKLKEIDTIKAFKNFGKFFIANVANHNYTALIMKLEIYSIRITFTECMQTYA